MALQSAMSATPLEKFCTEDEMSDEDRFSLRLSDGDEEDTEKNETQKTDKAASSERLETEEEILNKFDNAEPQSDVAVDEDALLNEKQEETVLKTNDTNNDETAPIPSCEDASKDATTKIEEETEDSNKKYVSEKEDTNEKKDINGSEKETSTNTVQMDTDNRVEENTDSSQPDKINGMNTVSNDFKDTMDTEDLLQVTSVKEADVANENSSSASSEKDDLEESVDPSNDDTNEREDDDNEELIERPSEGADCGDMVDIEENNPLGDEVSEEMDKDYENLLNSEKESAAAEVSEKPVKENGNNSMEVNTKANEEKESGIAENSISKDTSKAKDGDMSLKNGDQEKTDNTTKSKDNEKTIQCRSFAKLFTQNAPVNGLSAEEDGSSTKSAKRSLSECETEIGSKKIRLTESPVQAEKRIVVLQTLADFMKTKSMRKLSRRHLEEFCIQKMCEVLIHKSEIGELRHQLQTQEHMMDFWKKETTAMAKQVKDLEIVNKKMLNELKLRHEKDTPPVPVKITRSVGLQVKLDTILARRISRSGAEISHTAQTQSKSTVNNATKAASKAISPQISNRSVKETSAAPSLTLLSQALAKDQLPNNANGSSVSGASTATTDSSSNTGAEPRGVIDLTDEDEKASNNAYVSNTILAVPQTKTQTTTTVRTTPISSIAIVASKPSTTGVATSTAPRFMYVLQPNPQLPQTVTGDLSKPGTTKAVMLKLPNGVIGQTNGIIPALQNGSSTICSLPQTALRAGQVRLQSPTTTNVIRTKNIIRHPAPLPPPPTPTVTVSRKPVPPKPQLSIRKSGQGIVLSWKLPFPLDNYETIASYQLYAYQETSSPPNSEMWRKVGDVKALALPMACTLTQFADGNKYYFAVRAVDVCKRIGQFSDPEPISL